MSYENECRGEKMKKKFETVRPTLKVGSNCGLMNVSGILEMNQHLSYALSYSDFDFLYHPEYYLTYINPKRPEEYVSPTNELIITSSIDLLFHKDYSHYTAMVGQSYDLIHVENVYEGEKRPDLDTEMKYIQNEIPLIYSADHYYLADCYREQFPTMLHYHSGSHGAVLADIDLEQQQCTIMDKFFGVLLDVPIEKYIESKMSEYLNYNYFSVVHYKEMDLPERERIRVLLKKNIQQTLQEKVEIQGREYYKNVVGLKMLIEDLPHFLGTLSELKGKYAPQFMTNTFTPIILQKMGFKNLMSYVSEEVTELQEILDPLQRVSDLWNRVDALCDMCFLKGQQVLDYMSRYHDTFCEIYEWESRIFMKLAEVETIL